MRKLTLFALAALALSACSDVYYKGITYTIDTDFYYPGRLYHPRELRSIRVCWRIVGAPPTAPVCNTYRLGSPVGGVNLARRVDITEPDAFVALATSVDFEVVGCTTGDCSCGSLDGEIPRDPPGAVVRQRSIARLSPQGGLRRIFLSRDCYNVVCMPENGVERTCVAGGRCVPIDQVGLDVTGADDAGAPPSTDASARPPIDAGRWEAGSQPPGTNPSTEIGPDPHDLRRAYGTTHLGVLLPETAPPRFPEGGGGIVSPPDNRPRSWRSTEPSTDFFQRTAGDDFQRLADASTIQMLRSP